MKTVEITENNRSLPTIYLVEDVPGLPKECVENYTAVTYLVTGDWYCRKHARTFTEDESVCVHIRTAKDLYSKDFVRSKTP